MIANIHSIFVVVYALPHAKSQMNFICGVFCYKTFPRSREKYVCFDRETFEQPQATPSVSNFFPWTFAAACTVLTQLQEYLLKYKALFQMYFFQCFLTVYCGNDEYCTQQMFSIRNKTSIESFGLSVFELNYKWRHALFLILIFGLPESFNKQWSLAHNSFFL